MDRDSARMCEKLMPDYADLVYTGRWFAPLREAMDTFFREATRFVTGEVRVKLYKGTATALGASSPYSLYSEDLATFGPSAKYDHADSKGFVRLYGLPGMIAAQVRSGKRAGKSVNKSVSKAASSGGGKTAKAVLPTAKPAVALIKGVKAGKRRAKQVLT
jgi:argininosuccinate synthase